MKQRHLWNLHGEAFYPCSVNDDRASIWLDTSVPHQTDFCDYPYLHAIRVYLQYPSEDGLSTEEEMDPLFEIEDEIVPVVAVALNAVYVGRITTNGFREFYFYARSQSIDDELRQSILERFPDYAFSGDDPQYDPEWDRYFDCIYPNDLACQYIVLHRMMQELSPQPDTLNVDYHFYFDDETICDRIVKYLVSLTIFEMRKDATAPLGQFRLVAGKTCPPNVSAVYLTFEELAVTNVDARHGFTHCEFDCAGVLYFNVTNDAKLRIAADVEAGLRPSSDLERFGIRIGR